MKEIKVFSYDLSEPFKKDLVEKIHNFNTLEGGEGDRNTIKITKLNQQFVNIKAFRIPNIVNQLVYNFFRKSKAQRSFEYAVKLLDLGIGTPKPLAYFEYKSLLLFKKSFYVSEQVDCDLTYRELTRDFNYPEHEKILRAFTRFTYGLHQKGIHFLDHSPGNTLIKKNGEAYNFYLVDLNRMNFGALNFETRIKNFSRLTKHKQIVEVMSDEYSKSSGVDRDKVFNLMWKETQNFRHKFERKQNLKKSLKFWKK